MNIIQYFEANEQAQLYVWRGRIFQPFWQIVVSEDLDKTKWVVHGVFETDNELSYIRYISRTWYEN